MERTARKPSASVAEREVLDIDTATGQGSGSEAVCPLGGEQFRTPSANARDRREFAPNRYVYCWLKRLLCFIVQPGKRLIALRCETGEAVLPDYGVEFEISNFKPENEGSQPDAIRCLRSDPENCNLEEVFDYVLLNRVFDSRDLVRTFQSARRHCSNDSRLIVVNYSSVWQRFLGWSREHSSVMRRNCLSESELLNLMHLTGFRPIRSYVLLLPVGLPILSRLANSLFAKMPGLRSLWAVQVSVARPIPEPLNAANSPSVSVIVPCRNEKGNVKGVIERMPEMGSHTEIIFCDDQSADGTADEVRRLQRIYCHKDVKLVIGPGICKADNVWTGFRSANGDILIILDGDLSVMPEELPTFFDALVSLRGELVYGNRSVYPMPKRAMKRANIIGNRFFGLLFSLLLDQGVRDTLCGTKALWKKDWVRIERLIGGFKVSDLWGDFELLLCGSRLSLELVAVPVHYHERVYGVTKMTRVFRNGLRMLRICGSAWRQIP